MNNISCKDNKNKKVNIAVLVSGGGTNLQALINAQKNGIIKSGKIKLVVSSNKNAYALKRAQNSNIKTFVCERKGLDQKEFEKNILTALNTENIEIIVLAGFMSILSESFIKKYPNRIINVHPSLIPSFCGKGFYGLKVHKEALDYGVKVTGATVHFVNEVPDGGKIIMQKAVSINRNDTPETLQKRVMEKAEWKILPKAAEKVCFELLKNKN